MELQWPGFLILLGLVPVMVAVYWWVLRRRRKFTVRYSSLALVRDAIPRTAQLRRHLPFALFLLGLSILVIALGRPTATVTVPSGQANVILAIDVSRSMCSTDIPPNRLKAAKAAVTSFISDQDPNTNIGLVVFAGFAAVVQPPTSDQKALREAVNGISTARRTAIGSGILEALAVIAEVNPTVAPLDAAEGTQAQPAHLQPGEYAPDIIVVLSDGASNTGPLPLDAAQQAAARGVRVYTIGYGTATGASMNCGDSSDAFFNGGGLGGGGFGNGWGGGGGGWRRGIDEETLMGIAEITGGEYYSATSAGELHEVFKQLPSYLVTKDENTEISAFFVLAGMLLAGLAITLSLAWHPFP